MDSDLEEIDIREAFTIFDNVSLTLLWNSQRVVACVMAGWERPGDQDRAETCYDEHGGETLRGGVRVPGGCEYLSRMFQMKMM